MKYLKKGLSCDARRWLLTYKELKEPTREFDQLALYQAAVVAGQDFDGVTKHELNLAALVDLDGPGFTSLRKASGDKELAMTAKQAEANTLA